MTFHPLIQRIVQTLPVPPQGRVCELGNQTWTKPDGKQVSAEEFYKALKWSEYVCLDISPQWGARTTDLNFPPGASELCAECEGPGQFDLVTNNGTGEHIFNQASVFQWAHDLCKPGGLMLHVLPWHGWINHGFYNYQPALFRDLAAANGYRLEALYAGERNGRLDRIDGGLDGYHHPKPAKEPLSQIEQVLKSYGDRPNVFVVALLRKTNSEAFRVPTQGKYQEEMKAFENKRPQLLDGALQVRLDPFPHVIIENALPAEYYAELEKAWPTFPVTESDPLAGNTLHQLSAHKIVYDKDMPQVWRRFVIDHCHLRFFQRLHEAFKPALQPLLDKLGQNLKIGMRHTGDFDISMDVQLAVNTPAKEKSRVRGPHVDSPDELIAGLYYFPHPKDVAGGDLILYRWITEDPHLIGKAEIRDELVEEVGRVPYRPNTAIFFVNGKDVIHGVAERAPGPYPRRYVNFVANAKKPVLESYERRKTDDWKGIRRVHQR